LGSLLLFGCGGSSSSSTGGNGSGGHGGGPGVGGGGGGSTGSGGGGGSSGGAGSGGGQDASVLSDMSASSTSSDMAMACKSPSDCTSGQVCCARITLTGGTVPNCTAGDVHVACEAAAGCATSLPASCMSTDVVRYCKANADCTEPAHNQCCAFTQNGSTVHFCVSAVEATFGGGTCN
jgi:hypothetical protein